MTHLGAASSLRELDLLDDDVATEEVRSFITAKFEARFEMTPAMFEEVVASVYRSFGYQTVVTGRSGDGGIDIVLDGPGDRRVGVQVKRYRNSIEVEQIRAFAGALMLRGLTRGIFVTTSMFQSGVSSEARLATARGYPIELIDAPRFYDALKLAQRTDSSLIDAETIVASTKLMPLHSFTSHAGFGNRAVVVERALVSSDIDDYIFLIESGFRQTLVEALHESGSRMPPTPANPTGPKALRRRIPAGLSPPFREKIAHRPLG